MHSKTQVKIVFYILCYFLIAVGVVSCEEEKAERGSSEFELGRQLVEQGRGMLSKALKRFMVIAPAIFFKLGIAFTLLLIVTLVAANNGFIGFLILVVGLSSVLARLQGRASPVVQSLPVSYASLPQISSHHNPWIDRSDTVDPMQKASRIVNGYYGQNFDSNSDLRNTAVYYKNHVPTAKVV